MSRISVRRAASAVVATGLAVGLTLVAGVAPASAAVKPSKSGTAVVVAPVTSPNGVTLNGVTLNGVTLNGVTLNGVTLNGVTLNGGSQDTVSQQGVTLN